MGMEPAQASILFLCDYQAPYGGNFIASMLQLDDALAEHGVKTAYLFPAGARERAWCIFMQQQGKHIHFLPDGGIGNRLPALLGAIDQTCATILHVHFGLFPLAELASLLRPRLRLILHFHSDFSAGRAPTLRDRIRSVSKRIPETLLGKRLQKITVSEASARTTADCIPLHNALAEQRLTDCVRSRDEARASLGISDGQTFVLTFGWTPFIKGVDLAAEAIRTLFANGQVRFVLGIVCGREYTPERMRAYLAANTGCTGEETFLRYLPPTEDVFSYHHASDILLSASRSETFSYALLEAICTKRPCVCSDIPGVRWAKPFNTVAFFPTENVPALIETLEAVDAARQTPAFFEQLSDSAACARRDYALDGWVSGMLSIYGM